MWSLQSGDQTFTSLNLVSCNYVYLPDLIKFKCPLAALCGQYVSRSIWTSRSGSQDGRKSFDGEMCVYKTRLNLTLWEKTNPMLLNTETVHTSSHDWKPLSNITHTQSFTFHTNCPLKDLSPLTAVTSVLHNAAPSVIPCALENICWTWPCLTKESVWLFAELAPNHITATLSRLAAHAVSAWYFYNV